MVCQVQQKFMYEGKVGVWNLQKNTFTTTNGSSQEVPSTRQSFKNVLVRECQYPFSRAVLVFVWTVVWLYILYTYISGGIDNTVKKLDPDMDAWINLGISSLLCTVASVFFLVFVWKYLTLYADVQFYLEYLFSHDTVLKYLKMLFGVSALAFLFVALNLGKMYLRLSVTCFLILSLCLYQSRFVEQAFETGTPHNSHYLMTSTTELSSGL